MKANGNGTANLGFETKLWLAADKLRGTMDAADYKHTVLGLIFLKYISDSFGTRRLRLARETADPDSERMINGRQKLECWGSGVIPRLATEFKNEMPGLKGFSERNIGLMSAFHREYPDPDSILQLPVAKLTEGSIVQCPVAQIEGASFWSIPWAHHVILIQKVKDLSVRRWYMEQTLTNGRRRQPRLSSSRRNCSAVTGQRMWHSPMKWRSPPWLPQW